MLCYVLVKSVGMWPFSNSLAAILANPTHWQQFASWDTGASSNGHEKISLKLIINSIKASFWTGDSFQNPVLIQTLCEFNSFDKTDEKCILAYEQLLKRRSRLVHHRLVTLYIQREKKPSKMYSTISFFLKKKESTGVCISEIPECSRVFSSGTKGLYPRQFSAESRSLLSGIRVGEGEHRLLRRALPPIGLLPLGGQRQLRRDHPRSQFAGVLWDFSELLSQQFRSRSRPFNQHQAHRIRSRCGWLLFQLRKRAIKH